LHYQWQQSADGVTWTNLIGATQDVFDLKAVNVGQRLRSAVSYTDLQGTSEQVISDPTAIVAHTNHLPTGAVTLTGTTTTAGTLTSAASLADSDGMGVISTSWQSSSDGTKWTTIDGANSTSMALAGLAGKYVRSVASFVDIAGTTEIVNSASSAQINDAPIGQITITGEAKQGQTLTATADLSDNNGLGELHWQWQQLSASSVWQNVALQTNTSLILDQSNVGKTLRAVATYKDGAGVNEAVISAPTSAVANVDDPTKGALQISGVLNDGQTITASVGGLTDADGIGTFTYQWQLKVAPQTWVSIAGADKQGLKLDQTYVGKEVRFFTEHTDLGGYKATLTSDSYTVVNANDAPTGQLVTTGSQIVGSLLTVSASAVADLDGLGSFSYQWQSLSQGGKWKDILGQTATTMTLTNDLATQKTRAVVSYTDAFGTHEQVVGSATGPIKASDLADNHVTGSVHLDGRFAVNQTIVASNTLTDADWLTNVAYQWQMSGNGASGWKNIAGATQEQLSLSGSMQSKYVRVVATTTDELGGHDQVFGDASLKIARANIAPKFAKNSLSLKVLENMSDVINPSAIDVGDTVTYTIRGEDAGLFEIKAGTVSFKTAPDFETPKDVNADNVYKFTLTATDSYGASSNQDVSVSVANVNERPDFIQNTRTVMVKLGTRNITDFLSDQVVDQDTNLQYGLSKFFTISGDDAAFFSTTASRLNLAKGMGLGTYHIDVMARDIGGLTTDLQAVTFEIVDNIQSVATTGNDHLMGTNGADVMNGGLGDDKLLGGTGLDTFIVNAGADTIYDFGFGGQEILQVGLGATAKADVTCDWTATSATVNLGTATMVSTGANIDLSAVQSGNGFTLYAESGHGNLSGSGLADTLFASSEGNVLRGGDGNDSLQGGAGADKFVIEGLGLDTVFNFQSGKDVIALTNLGLSKGTLSADTFTKDAGLHEATTAAQRIIYDTTSGNVWFDADGVGAQQAVLLAVMPQLPEIKNTDFVVI